MTDEQGILSSRHKILLGYLTAIERRAELFDVCSVASSNGGELQQAVATVFGFSPLVAEAVLDMQVRRFTPLSRQRIVEELKEVETLLD